MRKFGPRYAQVQKGSSVLRRWYGTGVSVPQGGPARDLVQDTRYKSQDKRLVGLGYKGKLASWLRVQGKFKGSNTPKGQRPGEFDYAFKVQYLIIEFTF